MRLLSLILIIGSVAESLKFYRVVVPKHRLQGEDAILECKYDLERDRLYSTRWFKDNVEIFRYVPRFNPPIYVHPDEYGGVHIDIAHSTASRIKLKNVDLRASGVYRCEVNAEAPSFASGQGEQRLLVIHLPKESPQITGMLKDEYEVGEVLDLNCTSSKSFPKAKLSWYINDMPVENPFVHQHSSKNQNQGASSSSSLIPPPSPQPPSYPKVYSESDPYGYSYGIGMGINSNSNSNSGTGSNVVPTGSNKHFLSTTSENLRLKLSSHHFANDKGTASIRCVASVSTSAWEKEDEMMMGSSRRKIGLSPTLSDGTNNPHQDNFSSHPFLYNKETIIFVRGSSPPLLISASVQLVLFTTTTLSLFYNIFTNTHLLLTPFL